MIWFRQQTLGSLLLGCRFLEHAHDVGLLHDQEFFPVDLDLGARPFAEQDAVAGLDVDRDEFAALVATARTDRNDLALRGLFLGGVGYDDAAGGLFRGIDALDDDPVVKRAKLHGIPPRFHKLLKGFEFSMRAVPWEAVAAAWARHK